MSTSYEELAFVNHQLAGMLRSGIPLEGALRELSRGMPKGSMQRELRALESDLANGRPLPDAVAARSFPRLYIAMIQAGSKGQDLPRVLTLLADHFQRMNQLSRRLQMLLVYPAIVLAASLAVSLLVAVMLSFMLRENTASYESFRAETTAGTGMAWVGVWAPVILIGVVFLACCILYANPRARAWFRWRLPGFREASLAQVAEMFELLLSRGVPMAEAVSLVERLDPAAALAGDLRRVGERLAGGVTRFEKLTEGSVVLPPLFRWLVAGDATNWVEGFGRAARLYHGRATQRIETMLYAALPSTVLVLGLVVVGQLTPVYLVFKQLITGLFEPLGL